MTKGNTLTHKELPQINSKNNIPIENGKNNSQRIIHKIFTFTGNQ